MSDEYDPDQLQGFDGPDFVMTFPTDTAIHRRKAFEAMGVPRKKQTIDGRLAEIDETLGRIDRRQARLEREREMLEAIPKTDPYEDGTVLRFQVVDRSAGAVLVLTYAVLRADGRYWFTGGRSPQGLTWFEMATWNVQRGVKSYDVLVGARTEWLVTTSPAPRINDVEASEIPAQTHGSVRDCGAQHAHPAHSWPQLTVGQGAETKWCPGVTAQAPYDQEPPF